MQFPTGRFADIAPVGGGGGGILWGSAGVILPWESYLQYNDKAILEEHYPAMSKYIDYLSGALNKDTGLLNESVSVIGSDLNTINSEWLIWQPLITFTT